MDTSKRTTDQATNVQQALRRLKYLHTSIASPTKQKGSNLKPIQTTSSPPLTDIKDDDNEDLNHRSFLALSPDNNFKPPPRNNRRILRQRIGFRPVCKGRAPLRSSQSYFNPTFRPLTKKRTAFSERQTKESVKIHKDETAQENKDRMAKSAPATGGTSSLNPEEFDCIQCFADEVQRLQHKQQHHHHHQQQQQQQQLQLQQQQPQHKENSQYRNNDIKINRVTFSARPRPKLTSDSKTRVTKVISEKVLDIPPTLYGGWGVRSKRRTLPEAARINPRESRRDVDLTEQFQTLRITPCWSDEGSRIRSDCNPYSPPAAPPTAIRQIDIKMPEGHLVQYRLQTVP